MYELNLEHINKDFFSRKDLFIEFQKENPNLNYNSFKWIVSELISNNNIQKVGYNVYCCSDKRTNVYTPLYSDSAINVMNMLEKSYPLADFFIFESSLLNEFVNHQIANNTIVVQMEKDISAFAFDLLQDNYDGRVLYKPTKSEFLKYWCCNCIIVVDRISEAPYNKTNPHFITIEKLLVDIFAENNIKRLFSESEYPFVVESILDRYYINEHRMSRYARRRNALEKIKKYMK